MAISVFDLFEIGIGPPGSRAGGPMAAVPTGRDTLDGYRETGRGGVAGGRRRVLRA